MHSRYHITFQPIQSGNKNGKVKSSYSHDHFKFDTESNINLAGPIIALSGVFGYERWLAGYQTTLDTQKSKLFGNQFAIDYVDKDYVVHTNV